MSSDRFVTELASRPEITRWVSVLSALSSGSPHAAFFEGL
jgi:hypothetical protein